MPAAKKAKLVKVIKSIDKKKDVLTLECEWAACDFVCNDTNSFLVHISHHVDQMLMSESTEDAGKPICLCVANLYSVAVLPSGIRKCGNML